MDESRDVETGAVDIDLIYSKKSNLKKVVEDTVTLLENRGRNVRTLHEDNELTKDARFRVYFFNKAFKKYLLHRLTPVLLDNASTTPHNSMMILRDAHMDLLPPDLSGKLYCPIRLELTSEDAAKEILSFVDRQDQISIQAYDRRFKKMKEATDNFDDAGAYILIANVRRPVPKSAKSIAMLPWLKVFDFSEKTKEKNGFLQMVKPHLTPGVFSIREISQTPPTVEDEYTYWTVWEKDASEESVYFHVRSLHGFCAGRKDPVTVVVLWYPPNDDLDWEVCGLTGNLDFAFRGGISIRCILVTENEPPKKTALHERLLKYVPESNRIIVPLEVFLNWFGREMINCTGRRKLRNNLIPASSMDEGQPPFIALCERELNRLNVGMDLLTFCEGNESLEHLSEDERGVNFLQGDTISWNTLGDGGFDATRELCSKIVSYIEVEHLESGTPGIVKIYHHPGSGGTTLGRRTLWKLRKSAPCLSIEGRVEVKENLRENVALLRERSKLPVILLVDGLTDAKAILRALSGERIVIIHLARYFGSMVNKKNENGNFYLDEKVSKNDASDILPIYEKFGKHSCEELRDKTPIYLYEYGLTAFTESFRGIRKYVEGHLQETDGGKSWKGVIELLALAKHYGDDGKLPKQIFGKMLQKPSNCIVKRQDIGYIGRQLILEDKRGYWSIQYVQLAREILRQSLMAEIGPVDGQVLMLTGNDCDKLKDMAIGLIDTLHGSVSHTVGTPAWILDVLKNVFIERHNKMATDFDKYKKYSMLLCDVVRDGLKEEIFKKLVERFPKHADFHAHLGRFYSHVKKFKDAENALLEALNVEQLESSKGRDEAVIRIHHMLGTSYFERLKSIAEVRGSEGIMKILEYAYKAIEQFEEARKRFTEESNQTYGFLGEVKVRLEVIALAKKWKLLSESNSESEIDGFAVKSFHISDRLLAQCAECADEEELGNSEFSFLVNKCAGVYGNLTLLDNFITRSTGLSSKMCRLASLRTRYGLYEKKISSSSGIHPDDVITMVSLLDGLVHDASGRATRRISTDMLQWLKLVRLLQEPPPLQKVLEKVKIWDAHKEWQSLSTFYLYVINIALALNFRGNEMKKEFRKNAEVLREKSRGHFQRKSLEFLGFPSARALCVDCLINRDELEFEFYKDHEKNRIRFQRCTGTIVKMRKYHGILHVDGTCASYPIQVFCVRKKFNLTEQHAEEKVKVKFYMEFNPKNGAEAFGVAELRHCCICNEEFEVSLPDISGDNRNQCPECERCDPHTNNS